MPRTPAKITQADVARIAGAFVLSPEEEWHPGFVYFIQCGKWVKIGFATNVASRLKALQAANPEPLTVLASIRAPMSAEREFHIQFAALRHSGEWFRAEEPLMSFIAYIGASNDRP